jgi:protein TonB
MRFAFSLLLIALAAPLRGEGQEREGGAWQRTVPRSVRDDQPSITLELDALNMVRGSTLSFRPALFVRCLNDQLEAFVATGAVGTRSPDYRIAVRLRWNDGPPLDERWRRSTDYAVVFAPDAAVFVRQLLATPQLSFELRPENADPIVAQFNGEGLDAHLPVLQSRCRGFTPARSGGATDTVYVESQVDERAQLRAIPAAEYPPLLRRAGIQGSVVVEAVVDTIGRVVPGSLRVISSANAGFDEPAMHAVERAVFRPARLQGRPVRTRVKLTLKFGG